jgi:NitT/TauT family transport system substrate-binding protein
MILRAAAILLFIANLVVPAAALEKVTVATQPLAANGALFLAATRGYFKAEGLDVDPRAFADPRAVVEAVAAGSSDFGLTDLTAAAFNLAGSGSIKIIAAQVREKRDYEGNEVVASNAAYAAGLSKFSGLANKVVALRNVGGAFHYQLGRIALANKFDIAGLTLKSISSYDDMARAVGKGEVDAAIMPAQYARELLVANQAKLIGWCSQIDEPQLGALFASSKTIQDRRSLVAKFVRAYARGAADYAAALLRHDRYSKRVSDSVSSSAARAIAAYVYPGRTAGIGLVEADAYDMDARARIDAADIARQIEWYKAQGLVDKDVDAASILDTSFLK